MRVWIWGPPLLLLLVAAIAVPLHIFDDEGLGRYRALRTELRELEKTNRALQDDVVRLQDEVRALRADPAAVERVAREDLGMVREDEIVFQF